MADLNIIGVQFIPVGKIYHFSAPADQKLEPESYVLVNTSRGRQYGKVRQQNLVSPQKPEDIQPIERAATEEDMAYLEEKAEKEADALEKIQYFLRGSRFEDVKAVATEYSLDAAKMTVYLNYESSSGFDIRAFLRESSRLFSDVRLEVRQVGPRDVAKAFAGMGACGIEKRCCNSFLTEFSSISIKMAKMQDISLTSPEITGMCGRLRCCLAYENDMYVEARKNLPKRKKIIQTPLGEGKVVQVLVLSNAVVVDLPEHGPRQFTLEEIESGVLRDKLADVKEKPMPQFQGGADVEMVKLETRRRPEGKTSGSRRSSDRSAQETRPKDEPAQERKTKPPRSNRARRRR